MAKTRLSGVQLDEVSLVDSPAAQLAKVVLMKRDDEVEKAVKGLQFNLGIKDDGASAVQSVVFDKAQWDEEAAKKWLDAHNMKSDKVDSTENTLRYRQADPKEYSKFRMITPGKQISKALRASESLSRVQTAIADALKAKLYKPGSNGELAPYPWVRDMYEDDVVYDFDGKVFRVSYEVAQENGAFAVELGEPVQVEVAYVDIGKAAAPKQGEPEEPDEDEADEDLVARLSRTEAKLKGLKTKLEKFNPYHDAKGRFATKGSGKGASAGAPPRLSPQVLQQAKASSKEADRLSAYATKLEFAGPRNDGFRAAHSRAQVGHLKAAKEWDAIASTHQARGSHGLMVTAERRSKGHSSAAAYHKSRWEGSRAPTAI